MKFFALTSLLLATLPGWAANNAVNEACKRMCDSDSECVRKCVGQAELFELRAEFIVAVSDWTKKPEDRMKALRSGANLEILDLCRNSGWSLDNMMVCLRSYPSPEVMKNCKRLSPLQEEQVHCVRMGKTEAEIDACMKLVPGTNHRLECLDRRVSAPELQKCKEKGGDSYEKMRCLEKAEVAHLESDRHGGLEVRIRDERNRTRRSPASVDPVPAD